LQEVFVESTRSHASYTPPVIKDTNKEPKEKKKKSKKKSSENDDSDPSRLLIQKLHQEVQAMNLAARKPSSKILVIGAGIAGVAAARELASLGFSVTVLEARDRIGGRIHTITSEELAPGAGIDIGAAFIHGTEGNPITKLCQTLGESLYTPQSECVSL
jgi:NADPH-dependent 2,4-dienoyl-CoA reductase/sulfur reductase-like enzyme